ncbi:MAG: 50S ribosomal protein L19 [Balneolaceae bacterium]
MDKLKLIEQTVVRDDIPHFTAGDTVNVHYRVREGDKERIQQYKGIVINERGSGANKTFIVRKMSGNVGVERIFPLYTPFISKIDVLKKGKVRRSKLFYLRELRGKAARIQEKGRQQEGTPAPKES